MLKIGLTGGIGSGKTTASKIFSDLNIPVIDTDIISHRLTLPGTECYKQIIKHLGNELVKDTGELDRKKIAQLIFNDAYKKKKLEQILHPAIKQEMLEDIAAYTNAPYVVLVIPLLFETDFYEIVDRALVVDAPEEIRLQRIQQRENLSDDLAKNIMNSQIARSARLERADDIIDNSGGITSLTSAIKSLDSKYRQLANGN